MMPRAPQNLPSQQSRPVYSEEHAAHSSSTHGLNVDPLREYRHLPATDEGDVARLLQHRLADGEQDDHYAYAQGEPQQEEERADLPQQEVTKSQSGDHSGEAGK